MQGLASASRVWGGVGAGALFDCGSTDFGGGAGVSLQGTRIVLPICGTYFMQSRSSAWACVAAKNAAANTSPATRQSDNTTPPPRRAYCGGTEPGWKVEASNQAKFRPGR